METKIWAQVKGALSVHVVGLWSHVVGLWYDIGTSLLPSPSEEEAGGMSAHSHTGAL